MKKILCSLFFICSMQFVVAQQLYNFSVLQKQYNTSHPDTGRLNILLKMAEYEILKPGSYKSDLDTAAGFIHDAEKLYQTARSPESTGYITMVQADLAKEHNDNKTGMDLMRKAIQELSVTNNKLLLGQAYQGLSDYYDFLDPKQLLFKEKYLERAVELYKLGGFIDREAYCDRTISEIVIDDTLAFKKILEAMKLYRSINYKQMEGVYDDVATCYAIKSQFKVSLKYELLALSSAKAQADSGGTLVEIYNHLGMTYHDLNDYRSSVEYYNDGLVAARRNKDVESGIYIMINLCNEYLHENNYNKAKGLLYELLKLNISATKTQTRVGVYANSVQVFTMLKDYEDARQASLKLIPLLNRNDFDQSLRVEAHNSLIRYYLSSHQLAEAKKYLKILDAEQNINSSLVNKMTNEGFWVGLDTATHQYKRANYHLISELALSDSINKISRSKEIQSLQVQFRTKEKESQIALLQKNSQLEAENLRHANIARNYTIGISILLLIIALLLYRQNLIKQRSSTLISNKNTLLQRLLEEKEWLVKEVHHRVKNNLHTVICLLESQAMYLENDALKAVENSRHRIYAMSLIHQKLYQSEDIKVVDMKTYLADLLLYLKESFGEPENIRISLDADEIRLSAGQAIPIGLIVNEAITNAFKYAFPHQKQGEIKILLKQESDTVYLSVTDNGIGFKQQQKEVTSLGLELIKGLSLDLRGELTLDTDNGSCIRLCFKVDPVDVSVQNGINNSLEVL